MDQLILPSPLQEVSFSPLKEKGISLYVKRDDLIHPDISGNKWRKLKYNIAQAQQRGNDTLLTFGGAHSNHIAATAAAGNLFGLKTIGIIRGEEVDLNNPTLSYAQNQGMELLRVSRTEFRSIDHIDYKTSLRERFGRFFLIPQGGANFYGINGCMDIMSEIETPFQKVFIGCGTGTTLSGMAINNKSQADIIGVSALKGGDFLSQDVFRNIQTFFNDEETSKQVMDHVHLDLSHHFGGYAKVKPELIEFMRKFYSETEIKLDPVYTGKVAFAMTEMAKSKENQNDENWILIHSGGLQGIPAMEDKLGYLIYPDC